jgi:hypothetical protein
MVTKFSANYFKDLSTFFIRNVNPYTVIFRIEYNDLQSLKYRNFYIIFYCIYKTLIK